MNNGLAAHLRKWGLNVVEVAGWQSRGGPSFNPRGIVVHHTAGGPNGNAPSLGIVTNGRPGISGPLSQFVLGRDGRVYVVAGGRANHAGVGGAIAGIPRNLGNQQCWGIEAENTGRGEKWGDAQLQAYYRLCAALCAYSDIPVSRIIAHREWATPLGRKSDPAGLGMDNFRGKVAEALTVGPVTASGDPVLGEGDTGRAVQELHGLLWTVGYRDVAPSIATFGLETKKVVMDFQNKRNLAADGIVGPVTWAALRKAVVKPPVAPPVVPPVAPADPKTVPVTEKFVRFNDAPHVYEIVGSRLYHVTGQAWTARGLGKQKVQVLVPDHLLAGLTKVYET